MKTINQDQLRRLQLADAATAILTDVQAGELAILQDNSTPYICRTTRTNVADIELDNGNFLFDISTGTGGGAPGDAANITYSGEVPDPHGRRSSRCSVSEHVPVIIGPSGPLKECLC